MIYLYTNKRIFCILLFYFSTFTAQKVSITNNTNEPLTVKSGEKDIVVSGGKKIEITDAKSGISFKNTKNLNRYINLFLEPSQKLNLSIDSDYVFIYGGDQAPVHEYINEKLNIETFGKIKDYVNAIEKKKFSELKNSSEITLSNILKNINKVSIMPSKTESEAVENMKNYVKYNWLNTIFTAISSQKDKVFSRLALNYYYKQYVEEDIPVYKCNNYYHYKAIEIMAANKTLLQIQLPTYSIIEKTDDDKINQFLPKSCQKFYFSNKFNYLEHINSPQKEYYKKILDEKFND